MNLEPISPYAGNEIYLETGISTEEISKNKSLSILLNEQKQASINSLNDRNIKDNTIDNITLNYNFYKEKINEAVKPFAEKNQWEKGPKNLYNLAYLKRLIDFYETSLNPINSFLMKLLSIGPFGNANEIYNKMLNELTDNQKKQTEILIKSFEETQIIEGLHLPGEGLYSGPVKNGLPHTDRNTPKFSKGTLLSSFSMHYTGEFKEGKIEGKGIAVLPERLDKKKSPIQLKGLPLEGLQLEGLFENGTYRGKIINWNEGEYAGPTRSKKITASLDKNTKDDFKFNGKATFKSDEISISNGIFENDTLIEGTVEYADQSKEPLIVNRDSKPFTISKTGAWKYVGVYSTEVPHGKNGVFYLGKDRWEGNFEDGYMITGSKVYEDGTREEGTFFNNELGVGTRQKGDIIYSIDKKQGDPGIWKITDPLGTRMGFFKKIDNVYQLDGYRCRKEYTLNGIAYTELGTYENGVFKDGMRTYKNSEDVDVTEIGKFEKSNDRLVLRTGSITSVDLEGKKTVLTTQFPGYFLYLWDENNYPIPRIDGPGKLEDGSMTKEGNFKDGDFKFGKLTIKDTGTVYETISDKNPSLSSKREKNFTGGNFHQGILEGEGIITRPDGTREEGKFRDNKLDGYGIKVFKNKNDKLIKVVGFFEAGEIKEKEENDFTTFYATGGKFNDDGNLDGEGIRKDGESLFEGNFKNGEYDGIITFTEPTYGKKHQFLYENGKFINNIDNK